MEINEARFVISNSDARRCPTPTLPEYAFIGRSNVGKSSLINMLCNHSHLAKVSGTPGKTQLINHFLINKNWYLVDLPGYGYAKVGKRLKATFTTIINHYLTQRSNLQCLFILIDSRLAPQKIDLEFMREMGKKQIPFTLIFTKADKLKPQALQDNIKHYADVMLQEWEEMPHFFISSSSHKTGKEEILQYIDELNANWVLPPREEKHDLGQ
ncbi:GTP-binding protein [Breznakibacter xylanolyticus]|uniref:Probable GTP-binding protein EngB n=1 Tax=Breznakibacter xylanolyticus TaxID=990 RepID=A0A2W7NCK0_9BACT|nr:ribosome biogenesis GTP-binding protein YihA/YsxC [Breznakibacter xylanolyticus]MBN2743549.1 YihA family ribosome biogenesis GTP-binding protein [Marinilabiliaceae bacterium]PZX17343.1 GTP-binding protein [Breznakibacter xylanolyticus]